MGGSWLAFISTVKKHNFFPPPTPPIKMHSPVLNI